MNAESGYEIEQILEDAKDDSVQPTKPPAGKARLIEQPDYSTSLDRAKNEGSLINRLYRTAQNRNRDDEQRKQKQIAKDKIDKMYKSVVENPNLGRQVGKIPELLHGYATCPRCGQVVEGFNPNFKGSECPLCGFVVGQGSYTRKVI